MKKKSKQVHLSPNGDNGWKVHKPGAKRASAITKTKAEGKAIAERIARREKGETKIKKKDGTIQGGNSYGNDPHPPKDKNG